MYNLLLVYCFMIYDLVFMTLKLFTYGYKKRERNDGTATESCNKYKQIMRSLRRERTWDWDISNKKVFHLF